MRILLDTNLLVRAAITPGGSAREILRTIEASDTHVLVLSSYLLSEVAEVLRLDRIRARWPLTDEEIRVYCQYLAKVGEEVSVEPLAQVIEDPKDQAVIETAITEAASVICTFDRHFYKPPVQAFCVAHGVEVMNDAELLAALREQPEVIRPQNLADHRKRWSVHRHCSGFRGNFQ